MLLVLREYFCSLFVQKHSQASHDAARKTEEITKGEYFAVYFCSPGNKAQGKGRCIKIFSFYKLHFAVCVMLNEKRNPILPGKRAKGEKHSTFSAFIYLCLRNF